MYHGLRWRAGSTKFAALAVLLACARMSSQGLFDTTGWKQAASLPEPRWFHASAVDARGRIYAFGGNVFVDGEQQRGGGSSGMVYLDPDRETWQRAPQVTELKYRSRRSTKSRTKPSQIFFKEGAAGPRIELPSGASDGRRVYWFTDYLGPIYFDADTNRWGQAEVGVYDQSEHRYLGPVPLYRRMASPTVAGPDGRIWLLGGWGRSHGPEPPGFRRKKEQLKFGVLASVEVYDPVANSYTEVAPMRQPRWLFAASFGADGKLYAFGGYGAGSSFEGMTNENRDDPEIQRKYAEWERMGREALRSVEVYDPQSNTWSPRAPLPAPRQNMAAALGADGKIYVIGGIPAYAETGDVQDSVFVYDPTTDSWSDGLPLRTARQGHTAVATKDGLIYAIGGTNRRPTFSPGMLVGGPPGEAGGPLASVEVLDTRPAAKR